MITINDLPKDILFIVFNNLPANHLEEIEKVSRKWRNILQDGYFPFRLRQKLLHKTMFDNNSPLWTIEKKTYYNLFNNKCETCFGDFNGNMPRAEICTKCKGWFHFRNKCMPIFSSNPANILCYDCCEYSKCVCGRRDFTARFVTCEKCDKTFCKDCISICFSCSKNICYKCVTDANDILHESTHVGKICIDCIDSLLSCVSCHQVITINMNRILCNNCDKYMCCKCTAESARFDDIGPSLFYICKVCIKKQFNFDQ